MKEIELLNADEIKIISEQQQRQFDFITSEKPHPGQQLYELDLATGKISLSEFAEVSLDFSNPEEKTKKVITKKNHYYTFAINERNAIRKFKKMVFTSLEKMHETK